VVQLRHYKIRQGKEHGAPCLADSRLGGTPGRALAESAFALWKMGFWSEHKAESAVPLEDPSPTRRSGSGMTVAFFPFFFEFNALDTLDYALNSQRIIM
jgi:hypothetical protein